MRLWLAVGVLLFGVILSCGTEHHKTKRQAYQPRNPLKHRTLTRTTAAPSTQAPPEYEDEEEEEPEVSPAPPVSYVRRPFQVTTQSPRNEAAFINPSGTGLRNRPQVEVSSESEEVIDNEPQPAVRPQVQRRPVAYVPDPNLEDPDNGGYQRVLEAASTTPAPVVATPSSTPARRNPVRGQGPNRSLRGPSFRVTDATANKAVEDDVISKVLGGGSTTAKPTVTSARTFGRGSNRRANARTTSTTQAPVSSEEDDDEPAPPIKKVSVRPPATGRRTRPPGARTFGRPNKPAEDEEKPLTPPPRRSGTGRIRAPKPVVVLERPGPDDDDEDDEPSIRKPVTQRAPKTTTKKPNARYGNSTFRGRFRPKVVEPVEEDEEEDPYEAGRRRGAKEQRQRTRDRHQEQDEDEEDYDDYEDNPPRRNRDRGGSRGGSRGGGNRQRNRNNKKKFGRGPTTSPRPSTRVPPADLELRSDGRVIDYLGDPNLPRELTGHSLVEYPFYMTVPEDIIFDCDERKDGFYASIPHFCQVFHYCHAGNRYSFLCPNYTLYDQTTFTCRFANTVDCKRSANHFHRNDALYKDDKNQPITTTLFPMTTKSDKKP